MQAAPAELILSERLGRHVFSCRAAKRLRQGRPQHSVFLEKEGVDEMSVDRLDHAPLALMAKLAVEAGQRREGEFQGWAVVIVEQATQNGRTVEAKPLLNNPYHAEIILNITTDTERRDAQKQHAVDLATRAHWLDKPETDEP